MASRSTSRSVIAVAVGNLAAPLAAFATGPILAHSLGVDGRGEVAAGTSLLLLLTAVGTLGLTDSATYFIAARLARPGVVIRHALPYLLIAGVLLTVASYYLAPIIAGNQPELTSVIRLAGLAITPTLMIAALRGTAQASQRWNLINGEKYVTAVFRVAPLLMLLAAHLLTAETAVMTLAWSPVIGGFVYFALLRENEHVASIPVQPRPELLRYGLTVWVGSLSGIMLSRLDQTLMTPLAGVYALGLYAVAVNLADLVLISQSAIGQVLFAADARDSNDDRMYLGSRLSTMVTIITSVAIAAPVYFWVTILFGEDFIPAIPAVLLLLLANVVGAPGSVAGTAASARGFPVIRSISILMAAVVNLGLLCVLAPILGATGAGIAMLAGNFVASSMNVYFARRRLDMSIAALCLPRVSDVRTLIALARKR